MVLGACTSSSGPSETTAAADTPIPGAAIPATEMPATEVPGASDGDAANEVAVVFDTPGSNPRPLRETQVRIKAPINALRMRVTDLTYRGVVCGFTFNGGRPTAPVTIRVAGTTASGGFSSGPVELRWTDDGTSSADAPTSDNGWSFSADAYPSRTSSGWVVSIGAVTAEGDDVIPSEVTCELGSSTAFTAVKGPVGYWAGFATV